MLFPLLAVSAVVPSLLIMWFFHARDVFREPPKVLWATFGLGVLTIPGVLLTVWPLVAVTGIDAIQNPYLDGFVSAFFTAAIPEELFKFLVIYFYARRHSAFDEPMDGIVYGVAAGLGFATLENILYVTGGGFGVAVLRALTAVPGHAFAGVIMGYYVGQARFRPAERGKLIAASLWWPILLHGLYDFPLLTLKAMGEADPPFMPAGGIVAALIATTFITLLVEAVWALRATGKLRGVQLEYARQQHLAAAAATGRPALPEAPPSKLGAWLRVVPGFLLGACGGLATLGIALGLLIADNKPEDIAPLLMSLALIGIVPLAVGATLFGYGIRALNRRFQHDLAIAQLRAG